jgi:DNA-binding CsgD family transcriptional regulator/PAS domain-containing protein
MAETMLAGLQEGRSPLSRPVPAPEAVDDSFDEDLGWVFDRFLERTGAAASVVTLHPVGDGRTRALFARGTIEPAEAASPALFTAAARCLGGQMAPELRRCRDEIRLNDRMAATLSLWITSDGHHQVVATLVLPAGADGQLMLAELAAAKLQPVLAGYFKLWLLARSYRRRIHALRAALDHADVAVMLLGRDGAILDVNDAAHGLLDGEDGLRRRGNRLSAIEGEDDERLRRLIAGAQGEERRARPVITVARRQGKRPLFLAVAPVARRELERGDAAVIVYGFSPELDVGSLLAPACRYYGLSAAETRVIAHIAAGSSVAEAAEQLGLRQQTVRAYLKQVFLKTGTARQADLVRVMMASMVRLHGEAGAR